MNRAVLLSFSFTVLLASGFISACGGGGSGDEDDPVKYSIGDTGPSGVGIVFYITDGGLHGLEAAPYGWSGGGADPISAYSNVTDSFVNGSSALPDDIGTGSANTDAIIAQAGHTSSAAKMCRDYNGGGKSDWFLPSFDELIEMYNVLHVHGLGSFENADYNSSSECSDTNKHNTYFADGADYCTDGKADPDYVRPIRAF